MAASDLGGGGAPAPRRFPVAALGAVVGAALLALYLRLASALHGGGGEFAYFPYQLAPLPFDPLRGFTYEQLALHGLRLFVLGPALVLLAAPLARWRRWRPPGERGLRRVAAAAVVLGLAASAGVMLGILRGRAIFDDELTYRAQAALLREGRIAGATVPRWHWEPFTIWTARGATGKYLFGEPLVQTAGLPLGLPALPHLALAGLALGLWWSLVRRDAGPDVAAWATLFLAASPMFILTTATGLSQVTALACLATAGWGLTRLRDGRVVAGAALVGGGLGFALAVRPQTALPAGVVLGSLALGWLARRRRFAGIAVLVATGAAFATAVGLYDRLLTGSALRLPWTLFEPAERFGFGRVWSGTDYVHTAWRAAENLAVSAVRFNGWWLGWPLSLGLVAAWLALGRPRRGATPWLLVGGAVVLAQWFYYSPGVSDTGPIYYFELLLPAAFVGGHAAAAAFRRWPGWTGALLLVHLALGTTSFLAEQSGRLRRLVDAIHGPAEAALGRIDGPALLLYESARQESLRLGWINSGFPARRRGDGDAVVTYPRSGREATAELRRRYAGRSCWYFRWDPDRVAPELLPCAAAEELLARPEALAGPQLFIRSTAIARGLHPGPPRARPLAPREVP